MDTPITEKRADELRAMGAKEAAGLLGVDLGSRGDERGEGGRAGVPEAACGGRMAVDGDPLEQG